MENTWCNLRIILIIYKWTIISKNILKFNQNRKILLKFCWVHSSYVLQSLKWNISSSSCRILWTINLKHETICDDIKKGCPLIGCNCLWSNVYISNNPPMHILFPRIYCKIRLNRLNISAETWPLLSIKSMFNYFRTKSLDGLRNKFKTAVSARRFKETYLFTGIAKYLWIYAPPICTARCDIIQLLRLSSLWN